MSFGEVSEPLRRWSEEGRRAAVATLVDVRRSAPRPPGARFAVSEAGEVAGSVSSGCVEGDLHERLQRILRGAPSDVVHYGITDEMAAEVGLACGGEIDVLLAPHDPDDPAWAVLATAVARTEAAVLLTGLSREIRGRRLLLRRDAPPEGGLGSPDLDRAAAAAASPLFDVGGTRVLELEAEAEGGSGVAAPTDEEGAREPAGGPLRVFAEAFLPPPRLAIVGATPVAAALCHLAAYVGWSVWIVDPRTTFAEPARFPDAEGVLHLWPEEGLEEVGLDRYLDVVVLAHDRKFDVPALAAALRAGCLYVGQIGGRRTQRLRREGLAELGLSEEEMDRIHGPVGLDIGAETPEEIAVSILAELLAARRGR